MKKLTRWRLLCAVPVLATALAVPANASPNGEINTGDDLVKACQLSVDGDESQAGRISTTSCNQYLAGFVVAVSSSTAAGKPLMLHRLGLDGNESVCFKLPGVLKYEKFSGLVVDYSKDHSQLADLPALELVGRTLADEYPCPK